MDKAKEISTLWSEIKPQIGKLVSLCHEVESHYEVTADAYQRGYEAGLNDAWECTRKIRGMTWDEQREVFGTDYYTDIIALPVSKCIEKIRQYEQENENQIQVGDEIETPSGLKGYVVNFTDDELVHYVSSEGRFGTIGMSAVSKTGRHFPEIAEILQKMKEADNG